MENMEIMEKIRSIVLSHGGCSEIGYDAPLVESGINSLSFVEVIVDVEECYDIEFETSEINYNLLSSIRSIGRKVEFMLRGKMKYE